MILVTLGTQDQKFYRLLDCIEKSKIKDEIIVQAGGSSDYVSKKMKILKFINYDEMNKLIDEADLIITHGGTGSILTPLKKGKKVIAMARLEKYGEHINDHQVEFARNVAKRMGTIIPVEDIETLEDVIKNYDQIVKGMKGKINSNNEKFNERLEELVEKLYEDSKRRK